MYRKTEPTKSWDFPCHIDYSSHHMVQLDQQNLKDPIICPPKTEEMHLTPNSFLTSKQKNQEESQDGATGGLNKHLSTSHSRSMALNLSLPTIKQKIDQNNKIQCVASSWNPRLPHLFSTIFWGLYRPFCLGVTVKYTSIYNDRCWAHLGIFVSFMFWSSSPLSTVSWHLNCGSNSSARPEWTSTVDLCDQNRWSKLSQEHPWDWRYIYIYTFTYRKIN